MMVTFLSSPAVPVFPVIMEPRGRPGPQGLGLRSRNQMVLVFTRLDGEPLDGTVVSHQFHRLLAS